MPPPRATSADQHPSLIAQALEDFLLQHPNAAVLEDGKAIFEMHSAKYSLSTEHNRCTLQLWSEERNLVRRITATELRKDVLKLTTQRFGQTKPQTLELAADRDRRTKSTREATRTKYLRVLERVLLRNFPDWHAENFRTAMDLERSFGPAYARGSITRGQQAWAIIAANAEETPATIDGILTLGILWLAHCRENAAGKRLYQGLKIIVPKHTAALTLSRLGWLNPNIAKWELYELDERTEELEEREAADSGNLTTRLIHAPNEAAARERFAAATEKILALVPDAMRPIVEQKIRSGTELAFLLHGLEFARVRTTLNANSFNSNQEISFGAGPNETPLTPETEPTLRDLVEKLFHRRHATGSPKDPLFRLQPERWLESVLRQNIAPIDPHLNPAHVYSQVPAFAAADRGMLDLLGITQDGRLAVIELKADEDLHLALQGLDYWVRVRRHHLDGSMAQQGHLGEFQRHGYFGGLPLSPQPPRLHLVAPALRIHPATETVLKYLKPDVDWTLVALDERWRKEVKVIFRKRSRNQK